MATNYLSSALLRFFSVAVFLASYVTAQEPVDVEIHSVDASRRLLNIQYGEKNRNLVVAADAEIMVSGKSGDLRDIHPGYKALIVYDSDKAVIKRVEARPGEIVPAEKPELDGRWDEMDERLVFLMIRLANLEASLDAIDQALENAKLKSSRKTVAANRADKANEDMDRKGGGPMRWALFYGLTAEKFFYHPVDPNTSYHTITVLSQQGTSSNEVAGGIAASQGLPIHQRPPQFDYIYRANETAKARAQAEVAELKGNINTLLDRRARLEAEQAGLWVGIAFRSISHYDLDKKPLYRFEPLLASEEATEIYHTDIMSSTVKFMRLALSILAESERDQAMAFSKIRLAVVEARQQLNDEYLKLEVDASDGKSAQGRFVKLAKRLEDVASNLSDSYVVAREGDQAKDQQRKETFRAQLQTSLVSYAQIVLALDEMASEMQKAWNVKIDPNRPIGASSPGSIPQPLAQTMIAKPDSKPLAANDDDPRKIWINETYNSKIGWVNKDAWQETDIATGKLYWHHRELTRNKEYVELLLIERNQTIRLYPDKSVLFKDGKWEWLSNGKWQQDSTLQPLAQTMIAKPDSKPLAANDDDPRKIWINETYNNKVGWVSKDAWQETDNATGKLSWHYRELSRNKEYVELLLIERNQIIRFYPDKCELFKDGKWEWLSDGKWQP
jgi:hypothetical protein